MSEHWQKYERLQAILASWDSAAIAFSGGVDSAFLLRAAREALGGRLLALTLDSGMVPRRELAEAEELCRSLGVPQEVIRVAALEVPGLADNPPERCYLCKRALFGKLVERAQACGLAVVAEGSNLDDLGDYRPGLRAVEELGVRSPLREAGLTKQEIRTLSCELGLSTWNKPSFACLASRFASGERLTKEGLRRVETAEELLRQLGFSQYRVRVHGTLARIEVLPEELSRLCEPGLRAEVTKALTESGFSYVTVDLMGYRTGSMNAAHMKNKDV